MHFRRQALSFESLEPRLLLSADAFGGVVDADDVDISAPLISNYDKIREDLHHKLLQPSFTTGLLAGASQNRIEALADQDSFHAKLDLDTLNGFFSVDAVAMESPVTQLIFVDANIEDVDTLLDESLNDHTIKIVTIDVSDNALETMTDEIKNYSNLESIHIISHGSSGNLELGAGSINLDFLNNVENKNLFSTWKNSLTDTADLLIYGCNFAEGEVGQEALSRFSEVTGMDVAASDDVTGIGGDWQLEQSVGAVDAQLVVSFDAQQAWEHSLAVITVNTTEDVIDWGLGNVTSLLASESEISLREAIYAIHNTFDGEIHTIEFEFDSGSDNTITLSSTLFINRAVVINGDTDAVTGEPVVKLDANGMALQLTGNNIEVRGLEISGGTSGLIVSGSNNTVAGNYIVDNLGYGISISGSNNNIGGDQVGDKNIISGNATSGIYIAGVIANGNIIQGNWIGLNALGESAYENSEDGITINTSHNTQIIDNVLSGNGGNGINIIRDGSTIPSGHSIVGNIIGLNAEGSSAVANGASGIELFEVRNVNVGDGTDAGRNIVSGNAAHGIKIIGANTEYITISGNYVGTDISGITDIGNGANGIEVYDGPSGNASGGGDAGFWSASSSARIYIGGDQIEEGNLISGNGADGILLSKNATYISVVNNTIGLDISGGNALGNMGNGINIISGKDSVGVDVQTYIKDNTIAFNQQNGILVDGEGTHGVFIFENLIYSNEGLGIDLDGKGATPNDPGDFDSGANRLMNYPEISTVDIVDGELNIKGSVNYYIGSSGDFTLYFYYATEQSDNGSAYASTLIGSYTFPGSSAGNQDFDLTFDIDIPNGAYITASTMSPNNVGSSEFAPAVVLAYGNIPNIDPVGSISFSGDLIQGAILTAAHTITDANGISNTMQYQWRRNGEDITGATESTYTLQEGDVGKNISLNISYVDDDDYEESFTSTESTAIANVNDIATGTVSISGNRIEDSTLTATHTLTDIDGYPDAVDSPEDYFYQWYCGGDLISGATSQSYVLTDADVGKEISVDVSFIDDHGTTETKTSDVTTPIENVNDVAGGVVLIDGSLQEDLTLTADLSSLSDADGLPDEFAYQWYRDGTVISDATESTYTLGDEDAGAIIKFSVSYQDLQGSNELVYSADSTEVENVNDTPEGTLDIVGANVQGETLSAQVNFTDVEGLGVVSYQWYRDAVAIDGEVNANYILVNDDVGKALSVTATYTDGSGASESVDSAPTNSVLNSNDAPVGSVTIVADAGVIENEVLTVNVDLTDGDGMPDILANPEAFTYQWYRGGESIIDADKESYVLVDADVGLAITVEVSYLDSQGTNEFVLSGPTITAVTNVDDAPTGDVSVVGSNVEGGSIEAQINIDDEDGLPDTYTYQWFRGGDEISGATGSSYDLTEDDVGASLTVEVRYTDKQEHAEVVSSSAFGPILNLNQAPVGTVDIAGSGPSPFKEDDTLTAENNFTDLDGLPAAPEDFTYQWYRDGEVIGSAVDKQYLLTQDDVGSQLTVVVQYNDLHNTDEMLESIATVKIENVNDEYSGDIQIVGNAEEEQELSIENNIVDEDGIDSIVSYQWYRGGVVIDGAIESTYVLQNDDVGLNISVSVDYQDLFGQVDTVTSQALGPILNLNASPVGAVTILGAAAEENQILTASHNITDADGILNTSFSYQWYRDGIAISGEGTDTLELGDDDVNSTIQVVVSYTDDFGVEESLASSGFGPVQAVNDDPSGTLIISGSYVQYETLSLVDSIADVDGISADREYFWYRDGEVIDGEMGTGYTLTEVDVGAFIHAELRYTDDQGFDEVVVVEALTVANANDAPMGSVVINGTAREGELLRAEVDIADADGLPENVDYQWYRDSEAIAGATSLSYQLVADDVNTGISVTVSYADNRGTDESLSSLQTEAIVWVNHDAQGQVTLDGGNAVGSVLTVAQNIQDSDGMSNALQYQWQRDGEAIADANEASYEISERDRGATLSVLVSYVDDRGFEEVLLSPLVDIAPEVTLVDSVAENIPLSDQLDVGTVLQEVLPEVLQEAEESTNVDESADKEEGAQTNGSDQHDSNREYGVNILDHRDRFEASTKGSSMNVFQYRVALPNDSLETTELTQGINIVWSADEVTHLESTQPTLNEMMTILSEPQYNDGLGESVENLQENYVTLSNAVVGGTAAASTGLSVGYLLWTLRSGVLMTSLLSSLPAWRFMDPLPILSDGAGHDDDDDESLESMVEASDSLHYESMEQHRV